MLTDAILDQLEVLDRGLRDTTTKVQAVAIGSSIPSWSLVSQECDGI